ncbi:MAG TPA: hypothetical protein V6D22_21575 [Candidatus Obscuribacterales bacterium]
MRTAVNILLATAALLGLCLPAYAQIYSRGSGFGSSSGGGFGGGAGFGGGSAFGNGSVQMFNPAINNSIYSPYRSGGYPGYGYPGYGYPYASPYAGVPIGAPAVIPGAPSFFHIGPLNMQYWRSPSGYYYPWGMGASAYSTNTVYYINQGQTQAQSPPIYSLLNDMRSFLDESKKSGRLSDADYQHLFRRLQDIQGKYDHLIAENGTLEQSDEETIRKDAGLLGSEISHRVKPLSSSEASPDSSITAPRKTSGSGWVEDK